MGDLLGEDGDTLVMSSLVGGLSLLEGDGEHDVEAAAVAAAAAPTGPRAWATCGPRTSCNRQSAIWLGKVCQYWAISGLVLVVRVA